MSYVTTIIITTVETKRDVHFTNCMKMNEEDEEEL